MTGGAVTANANCPRLSWPEGDQTPNFLLALLWSALAIPICGSGKRVNCIVDGDTIWHGGIKYRMAGYNTLEPLKQHAKCFREIQRAKKATKRFQQLIAKGYRLQNTGRSAKWNRSEAYIRLPDGRDVGKILISEGHAKAYKAPGYKEWCR